jgi:hypothetical protein
LYDFSAYRFLATAHEKAANAGSQKPEDLADELDELAQLSWAVKRKKNNQEVTSVDLLEAADMLRQASRSAAQGTEDHLESRELIEKLRIRLSPQEEQRFPRISGCAAAGYVNIKIDACVA